MAPPLSHLSATPTYETGVFLALNAIPNAIAVMNSPRCSFYRSLKLALVHDLRSTIYRSTGRHRIITSEWLGYEDVMGDEKQFSRALAQALELSGDDWLFAFQNISSCVAGFDIHGVTKELAERAGRDVIVIDGPKLSRDWLGGYAEVASALGRRVVAAGGRPVPIAIAGQLLGRNEHDELENVRELRRMLDALGWSEAPVLLSGDRLGQQPIAPEIVVEHPYAALPGSAPGTRVRPSSLPIGISATTAWLEAIGAVSGRLEQARAFADRELRELLPDLKWLVLEHFAGKQAVVVGDPHFASAVAAALHELGVSVSARFYLARASSEASEDACWDPTPEMVEHRMRELVREGAVDVVVGSDLFASLDVMKGLAQVTCGFPSYTRHAMFASPTYGYRGVRWMANELFGALTRGGNLAERQPS